MKKLILSLCIGCLSLLQANQLEGLTPEYIAKTMVKQMQAVLPQSTDRTTTLTEAKAEGDTVIIKGLISSIPQGIIKEQFLSFIETKQRKAYCGQKALKDMLNTGLKVKYTYYKGFSFYGETLVEKRFCK